MFHTNRQSFARAAVAIVYLSCLVLFAIYTAIPWLLPFGSGAKATSLRLVAAKSHATLGENIQITVECKSFCPLLLHDFLSAFCFILLYFVEILFVVVDGCRSLPVVYLLFSPFVVLFIEFP